MYRRNAYPATSVVPDRRGGTIEDDRILDAADRAILRRLRDVEERLRITPPRCLDGFRLRLSEVSGDAFADHGELFSKVFRLNCSNCQHGCFHVRGHAANDHAGHSLFVGPLAMECVACHRMTELFDTREHGYRAELGLTVDSIRGLGERTAFACEDCGVQPMTPHTRFEYPDLLHSAMGPSSTNEQNLFTWFSLIGRCECCKRLKHIADFECD